MIGGNTIAELQISSTAKNEIGEAVKSWEDVDEITGFLDLQSGDSGYQNFNAKIQESTHVFVSDWKQLSASVKAENSRMIVNGQAYDVMLIDDPMGLHKQLEIYLKFTGGQ